MLSCSAWNRVQELQACLRGLCESKLAGIESRGDAGLNSNTCVSADGTAELRA